jgi:putative phosphoribosyl transferase
VSIRFQDRTDAGRRLGDALRAYRGQNVVVVGLPRGGVPVAFEVAVALHAPLDVIIVRKLGLPRQPEVAMGAVGEGGVMVTNPDVLAQGGVDDDVLQRVVTRESAEVDQRALRFRADASAQPLAGRIVIVVDDGIATGATARAACEVARAKAAVRVVLAAPVAAPDTAVSMRAVADEVVCLETPRSFHAVGQAYHDFAQVPDAEVVRLLKAARDRISENRL